MSIKLLGQRLLATFSVRDDPPTPASVGALSADPLQRGAANLPQGGGMPPQSMPRELYWFSRRW
jgi:hypothetical protein